MLSVVAVLAAAACTPDGTGAPTPTPTVSRAEPPRASTPPNRTASPGPRSSSPDPQRPTPQAPGTPRATGTPIAAPTVPAGTTEVVAPIERFEVLRGAGDSAVARITSGLPSGCAAYSRAVVTRVGDLVKVEVFNRQPTGNVACTAIYGMVTNEVQLGSGFASGTTYAIEINGRRESFTFR